MSDIDQIISKEVETDEDILSGEFCECGHEIAEHDIGEITGLVKCVALIHNGTIISSCYCRKIVPMKYSIKVMVPDHANNQKIAA